MPERMSDPDSTVRLRDQEGAASVARALQTDRPTRTTILHIGLSASGTAFLEDVLTRNADTLTASGLNYLGRGSRALRAGFGAVDREPSDLAPAWARFAKRAARTASDHVVLSMTAARRATRDEIAQMVAALGEVRVVVTFATVDDEAIATWIDSVERGGQVSLEQFLRDLVEAGPDGAATLATDLPDVVSRWSAAVGPSAVTVVTLPSGQPGPDHWAVFAHAVGLPALSQVSVEDASDARPGLSYSDLELLRRLNEEVDRQLTRDDYNRVVRDFLVPEIAALKSADELDGADEPSLVPAALSWAKAETDRMASAVAESGVNFVPHPVASPDPHPGARDGRPRLVYPDAAVRAIGRLVNKIVQIEIPPGASPEAGHPSKRRAMRRRKRARDRRASETGKPTDAVTEAEDRETTRDGLPA